MSRRQPHPAPAPSPIDGAKTFWKSLEAKADPGARDARATAEFPKGFDEARALAQAADEPGSVGRRGFMLFAGLSTAVFAEGCARRPVEKILPYTKAP